MQEQYYNDPFHIFTINKMNSDVQLKHFYNSLSLRKLQNLTDGYF